MTLNELMLCSAEAALVLFLVLQLLSTTEVAIVLPFMFVPSRQMPILKKSSRLSLKRVGDRSELK